MIAAGFLGMFVGANVLSVLADRFGRRRMFMVNLAAYSFFSLLCAFSPNLSWLLALRFLSGLGLGAELVLVDTYLAEFLPRAVRGRYIAHAYTFGFLGVPVAALLGARLVAAHQLLGVEGWRWLLVAGALGAGFLQVMRRQLPESPRWLTVQGRGEEAERIVAGLEERVARESGGSLPSVPEAETVWERKVPLGEMFRGDQRRRTVMWWIFQVLQTVGYYGFGSLAPVVLTAKGHTVTESLLYAALSFCGYPVGSALSIPLIDRIERRTLIIASALGIMRLRPGLRLRRRHLGHHRLRLPADGVQQRLLQRLPRLPDRDLPHRPAQQRDRHRLLAVPAHLGAPAVRRPDRPERPGRTRGVHAARPD